MPTESSSSLLGIALKYGLLIAAVFILWIVIVRLVLGAGANSSANIIGPVLFNLTSILAIYLGMKQRKKALSGALSFKEGLKTGMAIELVYATTACLFFMVEYLIEGPKLLQTDMAGHTGPIWQLAAMAFAGLFFGSLFCGLIYSTLIAFFLARRIGRQSSEIF